MVCLSADASADRRKIAAVIDDGHGVAEVAFGKLGYPLGNIIAHRASFLASGHLAVETSLRLTYGFRKGVAFVDFFEVIRHSLELV